MDIRIEKDDQYIYLFQYCSTNGRDDCIAIPRKDLEKFLSDIYEV
jgi:hypothetical protein